MRSEVQTPMAIQLESGTVRTTDISEASWCWKRSDTLRSEVIQGWKQGRQFKVEVLLPGFNKGQE